jgi:hypothetical protein
MVKVKTYDTWARKRAEYVQSMLTAARNDILREGMERDRLLAECKAWRGAEDHVVGEVVFANGGLALWNEAQRLRAQNETA